MRYAGIVVAGGSARRLSGVDKPALSVGGKPLLARAIHALDGAERVIAVGPRRPGFDVVWTREPVPGTGPVAALAAGLVFVPDDVEAVVVLAADLPGVRRSTVDRLVAAVGDGDGAVLVDAAGERQWLLGAWRVPSLRAAVPEQAENAALRRVLGGLAVAEVPAERGEADDIDTPEDLERHR
ncbi:molybdopterin-guanine dinucleotide biosynthesis protein [Amycolatopsis mediterranei S699]|uniref:Molybdopterin-guanine dinucleotide biosynthesis protein n=3 Tax=Amycolatopsis mediterranei TaxID=33910 RepID=A0A9R0NZK9_AMYMS|nr:molybdenum cofactor guanylyltransferase [Amycolatopsis mediterranei]ADJ46718.1 putative molybdopterin-guanine dinucleotide biosynthesis protein [Amycolatopsis mediterranei U32]AEK43520.1 molybdopterin-guanine dinucleotide biosynthesis protein [Amycolatopsis mediterranei S699]AFO78429.1 molybdopterin-guanine dinucleotide biosynthesis protein [Amycolatopsis mediterranei S699]AGT85557.1 molybdopterin-guanine dinucleotide biosynthesis protein [Amycolatopsis mediterranei RB]KDO11380.1 molybdopte